MCTTLNALKSLTSTQKIETRQRPTPIVRGVCMKRLKKGYFYVNESARAENTPDFPKHATRVLNML
jgi:hypothetical protein